MARTAERSRTTKETDIDITIDLDGGSVDCDTGI
ncbi:MAG: imidazoleglycerol phosphate dehydratase HisB, partial [Acidimicrobiales bacterium]